MNGKLNTLVYMMLGKCFIYAENFIILLAPPVILAYPFH